MTRQEQIKYCKTCKHNANLSGKGQVCGLTNAVPYLGNTCKDARVSNRSNSNSKSSSFASPGKLFVQFGIVALLMSAVFAYTISITGSKNNAGVSTVVALKVFLILRWIVLAFRGD